MPFFVSAAYKPRRIGIVTCTPEWRCCRTPAGQSFEPDSGPSEDVTGLPILRRSMTPMQAARQRWLQLPAYSANELVQSFLLIGKYGFDANRRSLASE
jgi:hypothetical protein